MSSAGYLMHGAAHASYRAPPRPASPGPAVNVGVGAHSVAPSAHATHAGASGEAAVVVIGTRAHAAGGVAAAEWLAATLGGRDVNTDGSGARTSAVDDGLCPCFEGCDTSASPSRYLLTVHMHDNDVEVTPLPSLASEWRSCWQQRQRRLWWCWAWHYPCSFAQWRIEWQWWRWLGGHPRSNPWPCGSARGRRLSNSSSPPPHFPRLLGSQSEMWESSDLYYHLPSWWGYPFDKHSSYIIYGKRRPLTPFPLPAPWPCRTPAIKSPHAQSQLGPIIWWPHNTASSRIQLKAFFLPFTCRKINGE